ncbi:TolB family protein [Bacillus salacetis]|uniref:TolB family protein n=1 Tax=Bacillus salacetis TaxID=2315464 RepID=UPI003B9DEB45
MGKKKFVIAILVFSTGALVSLLIFSNIYLAEGEEGGAYQNGTLAADEETFAYVKNERGIQTLNLADEKTGKTVTLLSTKKNEQVVDLEINSEAGKVIYLSNSPDKSSLYSIDIDTLEIEKILTEMAPVPESAAAEGKIYYVKGELQHIDKEGNPFHYYDLYSYDLNTEKSERLTEKNAFNISSLIYDEKNKRLFFNMYYSVSRDPFEATQSIYEMSLSDLSVKKIDVGMRDVFEMSYSPEKNEMVFKGIANPDSKGTFKYELFSLNLKNNQTKRITFLESYSADPVFSNSGKEVYFVYNDKIPGNNDSHSELYRLDRETLKVEKSPIKFIED